MSKARRRSDTECAILLALVEAWKPELPDAWTYQYLRSGDGSRSLSSLVDSVWKRTYPDRRNRPTARNTEKALADLVASGEVEQRVGQNDKLYRLTPSGREAAASLNAVATPGKNLRTEGGQHGT